MTPPPEPNDRKPLARSIGEFVGHIWQAIRTDPTRDRRVVEKTVTERRDGSVTIRETVIREVELDAPSTVAPPPPTQQPPPTTSPSPSNND